MPPPAQPPTWLQQPISGVLMDITGVLYDTGHGDGAPIDRSIDALKRLASSGLKYRFVSNETSHSRSGLVARLNRLGFALVDEQVFTPAAATNAYLAANNLHPHFLVHPDLRAEFAAFPTSTPNAATDCVVLGDAADAFTWANMNVCMQTLLRMPRPTLITMGNGKYYKETDGLKLDVGAYSAALQHACDVTPVIIGKPSKRYFNAALDDMAVTAAETVMIGDDIVSDVGGAQACGIRGVQVRTGKWQPSWESHTSVTPDAITDDLADAIDQILAAMQK